MLLLPISMAAATRGDGFTGTFSVSPLRRRRRSAELVNVWQ
jgi:hypothetical protein